MYKTTDTDCLPIPIVYMANIAPIPIPIIGQSLKLHAVLVLNQLVHELLFKGQLFRLYKCTRKNATVECSRYYYVTRVKIL